MSKGIRAATAPFERKVATALRLWRVGGWSAVVARFQELRHQGAAWSAWQPESDRLRLLEEYVREGFRRAEGRATRSVQGVPKCAESLGGEPLPIQTIAFYLPQFHPIPQNDAWWGKGFTEWANVAKAQPQFIGHYQPHLPGELGFYDLRVPEVLQRQVDLATSYGISAFCFHYYWFGGERLLDLPLNRFLADPSLQIGFCLCWANENWTRRWDGLESEVLIAQRHSPEDDLAFFDSLMPAFADPRYLRIDGKPILIVYRASLLPSAVATARRWRQRALERGLDGVYLIAAQSFERIDPRRLEFDAAVEFPPHQVWPREITGEVRIVNPDYKGKIFDYRNLVDALSLASERDDGFTCFKTVMPNWDNEPRKSGRGWTFIGSQPEAFARWFDSAARTTLQRRSEERLLFINAWNEWGEGAHLEPDRHYEYGYLHAAANVLRNLSAGEVATRAEAANRDFVKRSELAVLLHLYYEDLIDPIFSQYLDRLRGGVDLFVSLKFRGSPESVDRIKARFPNCYFVVAENRGRDVRPFLITLREVERLGYRTACKVHTKKSPQFVDGGSRREALMASLLASRTSVESIAKQFEGESELALLAPAGSLCDLSEPETHRGNTQWLNRLLASLGEHDQIGRYRFRFPAGSMYWFRVEVLRPLLDESAVSLGDFELEAGQLDGTLAHAVERVVGCLASRKGWKMRELPEEPVGRFGGNA
jgi:lipopolysaccharide biosynthesis protein